MHTAVAVSPEGGVAVETVDLWPRRSTFGRWAGGLRRRDSAVCAALSAGRLDDVLAALRPHAGNDEARRCVRYIEANHARRLGSSRQDVV